MLGGMQRNDGKIMRGTDMRKSVVVKRKRTLSDDSDSGEEHHGRSEGIQRTISVKQELRPEVNKLAPLPRSLGERKIPKRVRMVRPNTSNNADVNTSSSFSVPKDHEQDAQLASYKPCSNPLDRLCQLLLDWDIFRPISEQSKRIYGRYSYRRNDKN